MNPGRHSRQVILPGFGEQGQTRLREASVVVIGAGGLGAPVIEYLAAAGIGRIGIVDADSVDESNLQRQVIHRTADVGRPKTESAARFVRELDPAVEVIELRTLLDSHNAVEILTGFDAVIDGTDNFETRYAVADAAARLGMPHVWGAILRYEGHVCSFWEPEGPGYRDLFPETPDAADQPNCATAGVLGAMCGVIGTTMAVDAIKILTGIGRSPVGQFRSYDALEGTWRSLRVRRDPDRAPVEPGGAAEQTAAGISCAGLVELTEVSAEELAAWINGPTPPTVIDVREPHERAERLIDGSLHIPLEDFLRDPSQAGREDIVLYCASGVRSRRALSALARVQGARRVAHLRGGLASWP